MRVNEDTVLLRYEAVHIIIFSQLTALQRSMVSVSTCLCLSVTVKYMPNYVTSYPRRLNLIQLLCSVTRKLHFIRKVTIMAGLIQ
jgi:hypothetical protein